MPASGLSKETTQMLRQKIGELNANIAKADTAIESFKVAKHEAQTAIEKIQTELDGFKSLKQRLSDDLGDPG